MELWVVGLAQTRNSKMVGSIKKSQINYCPFCTQWSPHFIIIIHHRELAQKMPATLLLDLTFTIIFVSYNILSDYDFLFSFLQNERTNTKNYRKRTLLIFVMRSSTNSFGGIRILTHTLPSLTSLLVYRCIYYTF